MRIDLNSDLGEGAGNDAELLTLVTSANVACGLHAGDASTMRRTVTTASANGVAVGAHPGFGDRDGFGRREIALAPDEIFDLVVYQVAALSGFTGAAGIAMQHVKPHGALYNMAATDPAVADAIAKAVATVDRHLILFGLAGSELIRAGERAGLRTAAEGFADRGYEPDGTLTPRAAASGVVGDLDRAVGQAVRLATREPITTRTGEEIDINCDTICIHGDTPGAIGFARAIRGALEKAGVTVKPISS